MNFGVYDHPFLCMIFVVLIFAAISSCTFKKKTVEISESIKDRPLITFDTEASEIHLNEYKDRPAPPVPPKDRIIREGHSGYWEELPDGTLKQIKN